VTPSTKAATRDNFAGAVDVYVDVGVDDDGDGDDDGDDDEDNNRRPRKIVDGIGVVKFLKFLLMTFGSIALTRYIVVKEFPDHDRYLRLWQIFMYEGDSIIRDCCVFYGVGRMYRNERTGVDSLEWIAFALIANIYFECQGYIPWMQHAVTLYEMHCLWPWQLWAFAVVVVLLSVGVAIAHVVVANRQGFLWIKLGEFLLCIGLFVAPVAASPYFHFHHWFAGWLFGMHANLHNVWWSRAAMAYCWGMYVNGIAVYGRDPLLTCEYARFITEDQNCPMVWDGEIEQDMGTNVDTAGASSFLDLFLSGITMILSGVDNGNDDDLHPADWRNCSSRGYHP